MIAAEEKDLQSVKTVASLYNGQPTDTGNQCHSVGLISGTPSIQENKDGVSVENVHKPNKHWFVLRVSYGRVLKAKEIIDACHIECYAPMRQKQITKHGENLFDNTISTNNLYKYAIPINIRIYRCHPFGRGQYGNVEQSESSIG